MDIWRCPNKNNGFGVGLPCLMSCPFAFENLLLLFHIANTLSTFGHVGWCIANTLPISGGHVSWCIVNWAFTLPCQHVANNLPMSIGVLHSKFTLPTSYHAINIWSCHFAQTLQLYDCPFLVIICTGRLVFAY
jgi:hypothetical protein